MYVNVKPEQNKDAVRVQNLHNRAVKHDSRSLHRPSSPHLIDTLQPAEFKGNILVYSH